MQFKLFLGSFLATATSLFFSPIASANITFRQVSISQSQGSGGKDVPVLDVSPLWGLTLSFIKTNELVQQVRISDPARVAVDFDSPLGGGGEGRQALNLNTQGRTLQGATVIYLRQIGTPLKLPTRLTASAQKSSQIPLTVITVDRSNQRKLYQFLLVLGKNTKYSTVEVIPDSAFSRKLSVTSSSGYSSPGDMAKQFAIGLAFAHKQKMVVPETPLDRRLQAILGLLQQGETLESAAHQVDVPLPVVMQILQLQS